MIGTYIDIEKKIEYIFVLGLRALYSLDSKFPYNVDKPEDSSILISSSAPQKEAMLKPHIYITDINYSVRDAGLNKGYENDIIDTDGKEITSHSVFVDFNAAIRTSGVTDSLSKDIANRTVDYLYIRGKDLFLKELNTRIDGVRKMQGGKINLSENDELYSHNISLSGQFVLTYKVSPVDLTGVLKKIQIQEIMNDKEGVLYNA